MAEVALQSVLANGVELTEGAAAAGDTAQVGGDKLLIVRNGSGSSITVTIAVPGQDFTGTNTPDMAIVIPAGKTRVIPLLPQYGDVAINGQAAISYSSTTTVTRSVVSY